MFAKLTMDKTMPIGRYKGVEIAKVYRSNKGYIKWMVKQDFIKYDYPELYRDLRSIIELEKLYGKLGLLN